MQDNSSNEPNEEDEEQSRPLRALVRLLDAPHEDAKRSEGVAGLLPYMWHRSPWVRYRVACGLTTRIFLPYTASLLEYRSFPAEFLRELRKHSERTAPPSAELRRKAVVVTLKAMQNLWLRRAAEGFAVSVDVGMDICEAVGRLGLHEAEDSLLEMVQRRYYDQVGTAAMVAIAALPPERLILFWNALHSGVGDWRKRVARSIAYMRNPAAVQPLIQALPYQMELGMYVESVALPIVRTLGYIGDPSALPTLTAIARDDKHPLQHVARTAIRRLHKEAEGLEEVTLVRASAASTLQESTLLRAAHADPDIRPEELLRPATETSDPPRNSDTA